MSTLINRKLKYKRQRLYNPTKNRPAHPDEDINKTWHDFVMNGVHRRKAAVYAVSISQNDVTTFRNMACTTIAILAELYFCTIPFPPTMNILDKMLCEIIEMGTVIWMNQMRDNLLSNALVSCVDTSALLSQRIDEIQRPIKSIVKEIAQTDFVDPTPSIKAFLEDGFMSCDEALKSVPFKCMDDPDKQILTHHCPSLPLYACEKLEYYSFKLKEIGIYVDLLKLFPKSYLYKMIGNGYEQVLEIVEKVQQSRLPIEYLNDICDIAEANIAIRLLLNDGDDVKQKRDLYRREIYSFNGVCAKRMCTEILNKEAENIADIGYIINYLETSIEGSQREPEKYEIYFNTLLVLQCSSALQQIYLLTEQQKKDFGPLTPWVLIHRLVPKMNVDYFKERVDIAKTALPHGLEFENPKHGTVSFKSIGKIMKEIASTNTMCSTICAELTQDTITEQQCMYMGLQMTREFDRLAEERNAMHSGAVITTKHNRTFLVHCKRMHSSCNYYIFDSHAVSIKGTAVFIAVNSEELLYHTLSDLLKPNLIDIYTVDFLAWNVHTPAILNNSFMKQLINRPKFETMVNLLERDYIHESRKRGGKM